MQNVTQKIEEEKNAPKKRKTLVKKGPAFSAA